MRRAILVAVALLATATTAVQAAAPVSRLAGGSRDCLATLELIGTEVSPKAKTVVCHDGSLACDRDGLVNGRCEFWTRLCANEGGACGTVERITRRRAAGDADLDMLGRTLEGDVARRPTRRAPPRRVSPSRSASARTAARARRRKRVGWRAPPPRRQRRRRRRRLVRLQAARQGEAPRRHLVRIDPEAHLREELRVLRLPWHRQSCRRASC